jgi:hypothetical protein
MYIKGKQPQEAAIINQMEQAEENDEGKQLAQAINNEPEIVENKLNDREFDI